MARAGVIRRFAVLAALAAPLLAVACTSARDGCTGHKCAAAEGILVTGSIIVAGGDGGGQTPARGQVVIHRLTATGVAVGAGYFDGHTPFRVYVPVRGTYFLTAATPGVSGVPCSSRAAITVTKPTVANVYCDIK